MDHKEIGGSFLLSLELFITNNFDTTIMGCHIKWSRYEDYPYTLPVSRVNNNALKVLSMADYPLLMAACCFCRVDGS